MIVKTYGLYDGVSKHFIQTFTSENDDTAKRSCEYIVHDKNADIRKLKDCTVEYLYSFDTSTGEIADVSRHTICAFSSIIESSGVASFDPTELEKIYGSINSNKTVLETILTKLGDFEQRFNGCLSSIALLKQTVSQIISGDIVCQKKKRK